MKKTLYILFFLCYTNFGVCNNTIHLQSKPQQEAKNEQKFKLFWNKFVKIVSQKNIDIKKLQAVSNKVILRLPEKKYMSFSVFSKKELASVFDEKIKTAIVNPKKIEFSTDEYYSSFFKNLFIKDSKNYILYEVQIEKYVNPQDHVPEILMLYFIETKHGFKFFS